MKRKKEAYLRPGSVISLDGDWLLAVDHKNTGRQEGWQHKPALGALSTPVPWIMQDSFPDYHGVAWYWRQFALPDSARAGGENDLCYLLRFWAVDYLAEVWVNGKPAGMHEGGETPFVLDVTQSLRPRGANLIAVRVLNPTHDPIDGIALNETPHRNKVLPYRAGSAWNQGGIVDSVEMLLKPALYIEDVFVRPDCKTGDLRVETQLRNTMSRPASVHVEISVAPAATGDTIDYMSTRCTVSSGCTILEHCLHVETPRLWQLNDPFLYRVTVRVRRARSAVFDEHSVCCGFRDFRFEDGYFRLNGRRIYLKCSHTGNCCPVGLELPLDPDWLRRDLLNVKVMGFNAIRFIAGMPKRYQLDLCDEIGLMVYEESYAGWCLADSPKMAERFDRSTVEMIRRDRNHPSVVIWGLLNETPDGTVFRHAVKALSLVRTLDETRMVVLNSGRWDGQLSIGSLSNPGSMEWEHHLGAERPLAPASSMTPPGGYCQHMGDIHAYPRVPHTAEIIHWLRTVGRDTNSVFLSEYGIGSAVDLLRVTYHYECFGREHAMDARFYREKLDCFLADWKRWKMSEVFPRPEDFFAASIRRMAGQRTLGLNAIRSNPKIIGHSLTGTVDQGMTGEGLFTTFRELKPGTMDAIFDGWAPLRLCLFVEPVHIYRGETVSLEVVLANEDVLQPGKYPLRLQVVGPQNERVWEQKISVTVPEVTGGHEPPFAVQVFCEGLRVDGPTGKYRFLASFKRGAPAAGGEVEFYVTDAAEMPLVEKPIVVWGADSELEERLEKLGIQTVPFSDTEKPRDEIIIVGVHPPDGGKDSAWRSLARHIEQGATALFLSPQVFAEGDSKAAWVPLSPTPNLITLPAWLYHKDEWAKRHPIFDDLPSGDLMDYTYYREIIPDEAWANLDTSAEVIAAAINASCDYSSGVIIAICGLGTGRIILTTLRIHENLGKQPAAERLLRNMLCFALEEHKGNR